MKELFWLVRSLRVESDEHSGRISGRVREPQLKPTTESQAIARAHRMGEVQSVQVHRLLSEGCIDERICEILARKRAIFDEFARVSDTADAAPEAVDISEAQIAREVVTAERLRLLGADSETAIDADRT